MWYDDWWFYHTVYIQTLIYCKCHECHGFLRLFSCYCFCAFQYLICERHELQIHHTITTTCVYLPEDSLVSKWHLGFSWARYCPFCPKRSIAHYFRTNQRIMSVGDFHWLASVVWLLFSAFTSSPWVACAAFHWSETSEGRRKPRVTS